MNILEQNKNTVMVFGVFDGLHYGHLSFFEQAKAHGNKLVAVVARDKSAEALKSRMPRENEVERLRAVGALALVDKATLGDHVEGVYGVIREWQPSVICVGHDQDLLETDLREKMVEGILPYTPIVRLASYRPKELHASLRRVATLINQK